MKSVSVQGELLEKMPVLALAPSVSLSLTSLKPDDILNVIDGPYHHRDQLGHCLLPGMLLGQPSN